MGRFGKSFGGCSISNKGNMKNEILTSSANKKTNDGTLSRIGAEQSYGSSLYSILLDDKLCANKYLQKLNPFNKKVKKFFSNSSKNPIGFLKKSSNNTKSDNQRNFHSKDSKKDPLSNKKTNTTFQKLKEQGFFGCFKSDNSLSSVTSTSTKTQYDNAYSQFENMKEIEESQTILLFKNSTTQKNDDSDLHSIITSPNNSYLNEMSSLEYFSFSDLDCEIDKFLRAKSVPSFAISSTRIDDLEEDENSCNLTLSQSLLVSLPLKITNCKINLSPKKRDTRQTILYNEPFQRSTNSLQILPQPQNKKLSGHKSCFAHISPLATLHEEEEDKDYIKGSNEQFGHSMNVKSIKASISIGTFGRSMNAMELHKLKLKPMIDIPRKIPTSVLRDFFDRNAEKKAYTIRSEERKCSKGWTNINRYSEKKIKPIPSGCWIQGKDDDKILANNGVLKLITIKIINCPDVEEFNLGIHLEDILLENFLLVGKKGTFNFYTHDNTIFNEFLRYLFENSNGIKLPYVDETANFEITI